MNAELLLRHYERIADAPEAISRLRGLILDLSVRGKLVPPAPSDEPVSKLISRIAADKAARSKNGEFREPSSFVRIKREDLPFRIPSHWGWVRLIEIARPCYGFAFPSGKFNAAKRGMPLIRIRDISNSDTEAYFEGDYDPEYIVHAGDYLVGMDGDFNLRKWNGKNGLLNQRVMRLNKWRCGVDAEYVRLPLQIVLDHLHGETSLTTVKHLSAKQVNGIEIPLPPIAEQKRIVAKVDELMALCDRLEVARGEREATRNRLAAASLVRLDSPDPDTFSADIHFALEALPHLTRRPDQIRHLRQTILNLAVRGKLVPQDPSEEPASQLLARFALSKAAKRKGRDWVKGLSSIHEASPLPRGWAWTRIADTTERVTVGHVGPMKHQYVEAGIPFLRSQNVRANRFRESGLAYISPKFHRTIIKSALAPGDVVVVRSGNVGTACVIPPSIPEGNCSDLVVVKKPACVESSYLCYYLNSLAESHVEEASVGVALTHFNTKSVASMPLPLPPLAEQRRIIAKVDELTALCERLEASLTACDDNRRRLLEALLAESLLPTEEPELALAN